VTFIIYLLLIISGAYYTDSDLCRWTLLVGLVFLFFSYETIKDCLKSLDIAESKDDQKRAAYEQSTIKWLSIVLDSLFWALLLLVLITHIFVSGSWGIGS